MRCSICDEQLTGDEHNAMPVTTGSCCGRCNSNIVIPFRLYEFGKNTQEGLVISPDFTMKVIKPEGEKFKLKELQKEVQGYIEYYPVNNHKYKVIVNEEGLLMRLPMNRLSSNMFGIHAVGNVLVIPTKLLE